MDVVLLPGMDGTGILFKPFTNSLNERIKVTIIRYPCNKKLSYDELYAFVKERLLKHDEFVLVAESFSSPIAYKLATENISSLNSVIFVAGFLEAPRPILLNVLKILPMSVFLRLPLPEFMVKRFLLGTNASSMLVALFKRAINQVEPSVLADRLRMISNLKAMSISARIPCCYIQANADRLVPRRSSWLFEKLVPQIKVHRIEGPHFIMQANPEGCARIIENEIGLLTKVNTQVL